MHFCQTTRPITKFGTLTTDFEKKENYAGRRPGSDFAFETELFLSSEEHPDWKKLAIGIPISEIPDNAVFTLQFTGPAFQLLANGRILAEEFPFGECPGKWSDFVVPAGSIMRNFRSVPLVSPDLSVPKSDFPAHCWTPEGLNDWVGDVSVGFFHGEFHVFYLYDHRHHGSKFGCGGHQWGHLVTGDFRSWRITQPRQSTVAFPNF